MAAVDLILKTLMCSKEFREASDKNWDAVSKLIPGSTSQQCSTRWKELQSVSPFQYGMFGYSSQLFSNQQSLSNLLKYSLVNNEESRSRMKSCTKNENSTPSQGTDPSGNTLENKNTNQNSELSQEEQERKLAEEQDNGETIQKIPNHNSIKLPQTSGRDSVMSQGPNMVIHVCDESKNLKQDFSCPRDLLVKEMRYFAEYLSVEAQRWEEVDISVHCDVQIFDWLMRYVKRKLVDKTKRGDDRQPKLEPNNVISILISSDFLKMDSLVTACVHYCHDNMSAIVATPCNMNCINDKLVTRIADLYSHNELDDIKDRKDKFKSKLYCKKIEDLFDPNKSSLCVPTNASTLFRCSECKRLLTAESEKKLRCVPNRMMIDHRGRVSYCHVRDNNWNVNDYVQGLREKLKSWREVYWRIWGAVNVQYCYRCGNYFPCSELSHCRYHTVSAAYNQSGGSIVGVYPCCQQRVLRFDATGQQLGCSCRDHRVSRNSPLTLPSSKEPDSSAVKQADGSKTESVDREHTSDVDKKPPEDASSKGSQQPPPADVSEHRRGSSDQSAESVARVINNPIVVEDLYTHRNLVEVPFQRLMSARCSELDVFGVEEDVLVKRSRSVEKEGISGLPDSIDPNDKKTSTEIQHLPPIRRSRSRVMQRVAMRRLSRQQSRDDDQDQDEDEDQPESEDTEPEIKGPLKSRPTRKVVSASRKDFSTFKSYKWDTTRSSRWNQDAQREEDQKRMSELVVFLTRQRKPNQAHDTVLDKDKQKPKEYVGGIFSKIDHQFRLSQQPISSKNQPGSTVSLSGQRSRGKAPLKS